MSKWYVRYMVFVGMLGQAMFFAQAFKIFKNSSAQDVSLVGFLCGFLAAVSWLIYGLKLSDKPLIASSVMGTIGSLIAILAILIYR